MSDRHAVELVKYHWVLEASVEFEVERMQFHLTTMAAVLAESKASSTIPALAFQQRPLMQADAFSGAAETNLDTFAVPVPKIAFFTQN